MVLHGTGRAAAHLAAAICGAGLDEELELLVCGRRPAAARRLAARHGGRAIHERDTELASLGARDTLLLCVSDRALGAVAEGLAGRLGRSRAVVLHLSGARDASVLAPLAEVGCPTGGLHPLVALADRGHGRSLQGRWFAATGKTTAQRRARRLAHSLGGRVLGLADGASRARYHAAASLVSGGIVVLLEEARRLLAPELARPEDAGPALRGLASSVLENLGGSPPEAALTGPVARADRSTVEAHLEALEGEARSTTSRLYRELSVAMSHLARLGEQERRVLLELLAGGDGESPA